jgi:hypothetical protein
LPHSQSTEALNTAFTLLQVNRAGTKIPVAEPVAPAMKVETFLSDGGRRQNVGPERGIERAADFLRARRRRFYTMTVATTGQAMQKGVGWRKALRAAIADNTFVKGEGMPPRARRELLGHSQLSLQL